MAGVVGSVLAVGAVAIAFSGLMSLRPSQTTIQSTHEFVDKISQQAPVAPRPVVTISREHCHYNTYADIRVCIDLQTRARYREVKDADGNWSLVVRE
jgi:hypothetical protein